eukprot:SAG31_NODE_5_length_43735_cov_42.922266_32_plen_140_part_00
MICMIAICSPQACVLNGSAPTQGDKEDSSEEDDTGEDPYGTVWQAADIETAVGDPTWASQHSVKIRSLKWRVDRHERKLNDIINSGVIEAGVPKDGSPKALGDDTLVSFLARMPIFVNGITLGALAVVCHSQRANSSVS